MSGPATNREPLSSVADRDQSPADARSFLASHPLSYPSYRSTYGQLTPLAPIFGLPATIFINRAGQTIYTSTGQYDAQGALDSDIETYALGKVN